MNFLTDSESTGRGPRVTSCDQCGRDIRNDYPYFKGSWRDEAGNSICIKAGSHRPRGDWDRRRPK